MGASRRTLTTTQAWASQERGPQHMGCFPDSHSGAGLSGTGPLSSSSSSNNNSSSSNSNSGSSSSSLPPVSAAGGVAASRTAKEASAAGAALASAAPAPSLQLREWANRQEPGLEPRPLTASKPAAVIEHPAQVRERGISLTATLARGTHRTLTATRTRASQKRASTPGVFP